MAAALVRSLANGWVHQFWIAPVHHLPYPGFSWLGPWPGPGPYVHVGLLIALAVAIALGWQTRLCAGLFAVLFTWLELSEVATYLNHYWLVSLLAMTLTFAGGTTADGRCAPWQLWAFRAQIGLVYLLAGIAKWHGDWLQEGLPLALWLPRFSEWPLIGPWLAETWVAVAASWAGMLFDCSIPALLLWQRTRLAAVVMVCLFHVMTALWFPIGLFPWLMIVNTVVFWAAKEEPRLSDIWFRTRLPATVLALGLIAQIALAWRSALWPGDVRWHEAGFRFSWRVMLMEKTGHLQLIVVDAEGRRSLVDPADYLELFQVKMVTTQPDCIIALARIIRNESDKKGQQLKGIYAESWVSLNGRTPRRLIDRRVNLLNSQWAWGPQPELAAVREAEAPTR